MVKVGTWSGALCNEDARKRYIVKDFTYNICVKDLLSVAINNLDELIILNYVEHVSLH